jgi:NADPH-dependent 2,4-dienoyl-CoA reductase/sulfur reductase-like enzyme
MAGAPRGQVRLAEFIADQGHGDRPAVGHLRPQPAEGRRRPAARQGPARRPHRRGAGEHAAAHRREDPDRHRRPADQAGLPGVEHAITSNEAFHLPTLPKRIVVVGGGYIAVEFAGIFNGLGVETTLVYRGANILRGFDDDVRAHLADEMEKRGIKVCSAASTPASRRPPRPDQPHEQRPPARATW